MAVKDENLALREQAVELQKAGEEPAEEPDEGAGDTESAPAFPPAPPRVLPAVPPLADEGTPERSQFMTLASGMVINRPPAPHPSRDMGPHLTPVKKTGYMAKLCAMMVASDMQLSSRISELRTTFLDVPKFKELYDSHRDMMERTGLDHRFVFP